MNPTLFSEPEGFDSLVLRWMALEKECPIEFEITHGFLDPLVPVPNMQDRGLFLVEHEAIVQYLQERYPGETLLPGDPKIRAQLRQICSFVRAGVEDLESQMNTILPASGYLTGDQFTLADIYIGARLHERRNKGLTKKVDNYYLRLAGREAFKEAVA
jgi:glutathione S-transferase